jgi:hypothetical protein
MTRTRIFVDFSNFQLAWNQRAGGARCDWPQLPPLLVRRAGEVLAAGGVPSDLSIEETLVYASARPGALDAKLRQWLTGFLDRQPGFRVKVRERRLRSHEIHCRECGTDSVACPACGTPFERAPEKGVDAAIVTDLLSLAVERAFDLAILVTSDVDMIPAVEWVQARGLKVINAGWSEHGYDLMRACWGSFQIDPLVAALLRAGGPAPPTLGLE